MTRETGHTTLGYVIRLERHYTECDPFGLLRFRALFAPNRDAEPALGSRIIKLLVVRSEVPQSSEDAVPMFFRDGKQYSGDIAGWSEMVDHIGWDELHPGRSE